MTKLARFVLATAVPALLGGAWGDLPLEFEPNRGQGSPGDEFLARGHGYQLGLSAEGARFTAGGLPVSLVLVGGRAEAPGRGIEPLAGVSNYLVGDANRWRTGIPHFRRVTYERVYPGIDVVYYGHGRQLEYDFILSPGADPDHIRLEIGGAGNARVDGNGDLLVETGAGQVRQPKPVLYQETGPERRLVEGGYRILADGRIGFRVGGYDRNRSLTIDPVLQFATFYGGRLRESATSVAVDRNGDIYVAGTATSPDYPVTAGVYQNRVIGAADIFVAKLNGTGTAVLYATLVGGSDDETGGHLAVDGGGNAFVAGTTRSINFPTTSGVFRDRGNGPPGDTDGFVFRLNSTGSALVYSTRVGGRGLDSVNALAIDGNGNAYMTGETVSSDFPITKESFQEERKGASDTFVIKMNPTASQVTWSTFLGGDSDSFVVAVESGRAIAVDRTGNVYVAGITTLRDFPTTGGAVSNIHLGQSDVYFSKLDSNGKILLYSTFLGGEGIDTVNALAIDSNGTNVYVVGETTSARYPTTPQVFQTFLNGGTPIPRDGFISKMNASGQLVYSTFFGGNGDDQVIGVTADEAGNAYVVGTTSSTDLPTTFDAIQKNIGGGATGEPYDGFLAYINPLGNQVTFATYLGGPRNDNGNGVARDSSGNVFVVGYTQSSGFPLTPGAIQRSTGFGTNTAFIARIGETRPAPSRLSIISGNNQSADQGTPVRDPLVVELRDSFNTPISGANISFTAANAQVSANLVTTDGQGRAQIRITLADRPGTATVTATFGTLAPAVFRITSLRVGPPLPEISENGITGAGLSTPPVRVLAVKGLAMIAGRGLAPPGTDRDVGPADLVDGKAPTNFAGTCVTVGGVPARLLRVAEWEIRFQVPELSNLGRVPVVVLSGCGEVGELRSDQQMVEVRSSAPELYTWAQNPDGLNPVLALNAETGARVGPPELAGQNLTAAGPNNIVSMFGQGFGNTTIPFGTGEVTTAPAPTSETPVVTLDGADLPPDQILYSGLTEGQIGVYRVDFRMPPDVRNGNLNLSVRFGVNSSPVVFLRVAGGLDLNPLISVSPSRIEFGDVMVGSVRDVPLTIGNGGNFPLTIRAFDTALPVFTLTPRFGFRLEPGEARVLQIRFAPTAVGPINANLGIATDDPRNPVIQVPLIANVVPVPPTPNPLPVITGLSPGVIDQGGAPFNLVVNGTGFVRGSVVEVNGQARSTFFNHPGQLIAFVQAQDIVDPGVLLITVLSPAPGGGRSQPATLPIRGAIPSNQPMGIINQLDLRFCPLVTSFVSVLDRNGLPVRGLGSEQTTCAEDGQVIPCEVKPAPAETPASITIVYGVNGVTAVEDQLLLRAAVKQFVQNTGAMDRISVVHLEDQARPLLAFTADKDQVLTFLDLLRPVPPGNALYDGVVHSATLTTRETGRRQIVVLFTALDNLSGALQDLNQGLGTARSSGVTFYTIALGPGTGNVNLTGFLRQLARETGGQFFSEASGLSFSGLFGRLGSIVQSQYQVVHTSPLFDSRTKQIQFTFRTVDGNIAATRSYIPCLR